MSTNAAGPKKMRERGAATARRGRGTRLLEGSGADEASGVGTRVVVDVAHAIGEAAPGVSDIFEDFKSNFVCWRIVVFGNEKVEVEEIKKGCLLGI
jgi:hypothetical protein